MRISQKLLQIHKKTRLSNHPYVGPVHTIQKSNKLRASINKDLTTSQGKYFLKTLGSPGSKKVITIRFFSDDYYLIHGSWL